MSNKARERKSYSMEFKLRMLKEYYESGSTKYSLCKKYSVDYVTFSRWERYFESKTLSLPSDLTELEHQVYMARKKSESSKATGPQTESERLREENLRLRKALAYSELRNEALHELLKIGREQYGIDLLKKGWRQAVDNLRLRHPKESIGSLSGLFGKTREGYYSVSKEKRMRRELSEKEILDTVRDIRHEAPGIGAYKLYLMLKELYPDGCVAGIGSTG